MPNLLPRLPGLLLLTALLAACNPTPTPSDALDARTVPLAQAASGSTSVPFAGQWRVTDRPDWLSVTPLSGQGNVTLTITADRAAATPLKANQSELSGQIKIEWTSGTGSVAKSGAALWTVTAQQFELGGRLVAPAQAQGQDAQSAASLRTQAPAGTARGVIVKYRSASLKPQGGASLSAAQLGQRTLEAARLKVLATSALGTQSAQLNVTNVDAALAALRADPQVEYAVPNAVLSAQAQPVVPSDQFAGLQWAYPLMGYGGVWRDMEAGGYTKPVTVAVVDTGVRFDHPDLKGQLWGPGEGALDVLPFTAGDAQTSPYDSGDGDGPDTDPTDPSIQGRTTGSHGTHVTGIIAARWGDNGVSCDGCSQTGVVGASYKANIKVLPIRVLDAQGNTSEADVISAVRYAAGLPVTLGTTTYRNPHPAQVINLSLGGDISADTARPMCDAIAEARSAGSLVIAAAGNGYGTSPYYPAACSAAVAVGSVTLSGGSAPQRSKFSNAYPEVQLSAPGGAEPYGGNRFNGGTLNGQPFPDVILSTDWDYMKNQPNYAAQVGTSQASPQVAALAALLLSKGVTTGPADTLARLVATATDLGAQGRDDQFGYGMVNAAAALNAPAVSSTLGLRLQSARGLTFQPAVDALGRFQAYLGDGTYRVIGGLDTDSNGIYGEAHEKRVEREVTLARATPRVDVGDLQPR
ncbi:S8 family serine peptidase [Deinococcus sp. HMF7620]|uniref:S8 family serine peptidase n=1 Tax=Deinococcus arboris TaxID=2682977 RepID=A0A7C9M7G9_9DEIO|nr:S8 family serine peptidase [Deinococcus arboris]MVN86283.1 S8 family serine peptidase [Deinococcus arboris]